MSDTVTGHGIYAFDWIQNLGRHCHETGIPIGGKGLAVGILLATHADLATGENTFPTVDRLAEQAGCDERTVRRSLDLLQDHGLIECTGRIGYHRLGRVWRLLPIPPSAAGKGLQREHSSPDSGHPRPVSTVESGHPRPVSEPESGHPRPVSTVESGHPRPVSDSRKRTLVSTKADTGVHIPPSTLDRGIEGERLASAPNGARRASEPDVAEAEETQTTLTADEIATARRLLSRGLPAGYYPPNQSPDIGRPPLRDALRAMVGALAARLWTEPQLVDMLARLGKPKKSPDALLASHIVRQLQEGPPQLLTLTPQTSATDPRHAGTPLGQAAADLQRAGLVVDFAPTRLTVWALTEPEPLATWCTDSDPETPNERTIQMPRAAEGYGADGSLAPLWSRSHGCYVLKSRHTLDDWRRLTRSAAKAVAEYRRANGPDLDPEAASLLAEATGVTVGDVAATAAAATELGLAVEVRANSGDVQMAAWRCGRQAGWVGFDLDTRERFAYVIADDAALAHLPKSHPLQNPEWRTEDDVIGVPASEWLVHLGAAIGARMALNGHTIDAEPPNGGTGVIASQVPPESSTTFLDTDPETLGIIADKLAVNAGELLSRLSTLAADGLFIECQADLGEPGSADYAFAEIAVRLPEDIPVDSDPFQSLWMWDSRGQIRCSVSLDDRVEPYLPTGLGTPGPIDPADFVPHTLAAATAARAWLADAEVIAS